MTSSHMKQVIISSDLNGEAGVLMMEDLTTGRHFTTIKGNSTGVVQPKSCGFIASNSSISRDYIYAAEKDSQLLRFWSLSSGFKRDHRVILPGKISSVAITSCGTLVFVGIDSKIYVWKMSSGALIAILEEVGFQAVSVIKISPNDDMVAVGSQDGIVCLWKVEALIAKYAELSNKVTVFKSFDCHASSVTDVFFGSFHYLASVGLDSKLVLYDVRTGSVLFQMSFDSALYSVVIDPAEYFLMSGSESGSIHEIKLYEQPKQLKPLTASASVIGKDSYTGHSLKVNCLSMSIDGQALVSGSHDKTIRIWSTQSKQCMRMISCKGAIGSLSVVILSTRLLEDPSLKKNSDPLSISKTFDRAFTSQSDSHVMDLLCKKDYSLLPPKTNGNAAQVRSEDNNSQNESSRESLQEIKKLKEINRKLYQMMVSKALNDDMSSRFKDLRKKKREDERSSPNKRHKDDEDFIKIVSDD